MLYVVGPSYLKDRFLELRSEGCLPSDANLFNFPTVTLATSRGGKCLPTGPCPSHSGLPLVHLWLFGQSGIVPKGAGPQQFKISLAFQFLPSPSL